MSTAQIVRANDIRPGFFAKGQWMARQIAKKGKASRTASKRSRFYICTPPADGWKGGLPEHNGWRPAKGK